MMLYCIALWPVGRLARVAFWNEGSIPWSETPKQPKTSIGGLVSRGKQDRTLVNPSFHHQTTWRVALVQHLLSCTGLSTDLHVLVIDKPKLDRSMGLQVHGTNSTTYILDQRQHFTFAFSSSVHSLSGLVVAIGSSFVSHFSKKTTDR